MKFWEGSFPPTRISSVIATYLGHFGAPFLMPAHRRMFVTPGKMFVTFARRQNVPWGGDFMFATVFGTFCPYAS